MISDKKGAFASFFCYNKYSIKKWGKRYIMDEMIVNSEEKRQIEAIEDLRKELQITRIFSVIVAVLLGAVITGGIFFMSMMMPMVTAMKEMQPTIQKMEQLDVEVLNEKFAQLDVEVLNEKIEQLDIEGMNELIHGVDEMLDGMDAKKMQETLDAINGALNNMLKVQNTLNALTDSLTNSLTSSFSGLLGIGNVGDMD